MRDSLRDHIEKREADGYSFYIIDIEGLMRTKQSVRPKDQLDFAALHRMKKLRDQETGLEKSGNGAKDPKKKAGPEIE